MSTPAAGDPRVVTAARAGDTESMEALVTAYLPLVYNVVGRALDGHADVDDVVQETMLRVLDRLPQLREPASFRSWLVSIAMQQVRERHRLLASRRRREVLPDGEEALGVADPGSDFADLTVTELGLSDQRRETVEAGRWLDPEDRELLSLWWLELAGQLTRAELVEALEITPQHAAVRVQRLKARLETARGVVRALEASPRCPGLAAVAHSWDGRPAPVWRKRLARHTRDCRVCSGHWSGMIRADRLLVGIGLVPPTAALVAKSIAAAQAPGAAAIGTSKLVALVTATVVVIGGVTAVVVRERGPAPLPPPVAVAEPAVTSAPPASPAVTRAAVPGPTPSDVPRLGTELPAVPRVVSASAAEGPRESARVAGRDYARSVALGGRAVWLFNDTELRDPWGFSSNSVATTSDLTAGDGVRVGGAPEWLIAPDAREAGYEAAHPDLKFAYWTTGAVADPARDRVLISYEKACRSLDAGTVCGAVPSGRTQGHGIAAVTGSGRTARLDAGGAVRSLEGTDPRLTFGPGERWSLGVAVGDDVYAFRCPDLVAGQEDGAAAVARAPLADAQDRSRWRFRSGDGWARDPVAGDASGPRCGSGSTVQWVPALGGYLATYLPTLGSTAMYQVGASPFGPWSAPRRLAETETDPDQQRVNYALAAHPAYAREGGLVQYLTYRHPGPGPQRALTVRLRP